VVGSWRVIVVVNALNNGTHFRCVQFRHDSLFTSGIKHSVPVPTQALPLDGGSYSMSLENVKVISYVTSFPAAKLMNTFSLFSFLVHRSQLPLLSSSKLLLPARDTTNNTIQDSQRRLCAGSEVPRTSRCPIKGKWESATAKGVKVRPRHHQ
jgi:hypothetical protein